LSNSDDKIDYKFEQLFKRYRLTMIYAANQILNDMDLAEDAAQTAFIKVIKNLHKIDQIDCNKTRKFLVIIVRNIAMDMYKDTKARAESTYSPEEKDYEMASECLVEDLIISNESFHQLQKCISALDKKYEDVILLKYSYDLSEQQIAQLLNISYENVRVRLHRAKKKLQEEMGKEGIS